MPRLLFLVFVIPAAVRNEEIRPWFGTRDVEAEVVQNAEWGDEQYRAGIRHSRRSKGRPIDTLYYYWDALRKRTWCRATAI